MKTLGKFAVYKGKEYQFTDIKDGNYSLISEDEKDINMKILQGCRTERFGLCIYEKYHCQI